MRIKKRSSRRRRGTSTPINRAMRNCKRGVHAKVGPGYPPEAPPARQFPIMLWCSPALQVRFPSHCQPTRRGKRKRGEREEEKWRRRRRGYLGT